MKIKITPSFLLGVLCLALVLLLAHSAQCGRQCNTTQINNDSHLELSQRRPPPPRPPPPRPPPGRPPPPRPPPPGRPPPPRPPPPGRPPPPRPPPGRPPPPRPPPHPRPPPARPPPPVRPPPPPTRPPPPRPPPPRPPPPIRPPPPRPPPPSPSPPVRPPPPRPPPPVRPPPARPPPPSPGPPSPPGPEPPSSSSLSDIFPEAMFNNFIINFMDHRCAGRDFYNYDAFIAAAEAFPEFGNTGDDVIRKREIAAFFGQTSQETSGTASSIQPRTVVSAYCYVEEEPVVDFNFCRPSEEWPCVEDRSYHGRGPVQLRWNEYYGQAGEALHLDLLYDPEVVSEDPIISFETALWFWMTPQEPNKPSSHEVITEQWTPSFADINAQRFPGYGVITNIFNGAAECGNSFRPDRRQESRINYYRRYCDLLRVSYGNNLDCYRQLPFDWGLQKPLPKTALASS